MQNMRFFTILLFDISTMDPSSRSQSHISQSNTQELRFSYGLIVCFFKTSIVRGNFNLDQTTSLVDWPILHPVFLYISNWDVKRSIPAKGTD